MESGRDGYRDDRRRTTIPQRKPTEGLYNIIFYYSYRCLAVNFLSALIQQLIILTVH